MWPATRFWPTEYGTGDGMFVMVREDGKLVFLRDSLSGCFGEGSCHTVSYRQGQAHVARCWEKPPVNNQRETEALSHGTQWPECCQLPQQVGNRPIITWASEWERSPAHPWIAASWNFEQKTRLSPPGLLTHRNCPNKCVLFWATTFVITLLLNNRPLI